MAVSDGQRERRKLGGMIPDGGSGLLRTVGGEGLDPCYGVAIENGSGGRQAHSEIELPGSGDLDLDRRGHGHHLACG